MSGRSWNSSTQCCLGHLAVKRDRQGASQLAKCTTHSSNASIDLVTSIKWRNREKGGRRERESERESEGERERERERGGGREATRKLKYIPTQSMSKIKQCQRLNRNHSQATPPQDNAVLLPPHSPETDKSRVQNILCG